MAVGLPNTAHAVRLLAAVLSLAAVCAASAFGASALWSANPANARVASDARSVRLQGCGGHAGTAAALRGNVALTRAAEHWAHGMSLRSAIDSSGYRVEQSAALHVSGDEAALRTALAHELCKALTDTSEHDIGSTQQGRDTWIIVGAAFEPPSAADSADIRLELLRRVNDARAQARRCGSRAFGAAPALRLNSALNLAATRHAEDMLARNYFEHEGRDGSTPASRVNDAGYRYRIVGENIALGAESAAEAVAGWLQSPGHCENIMDARFSEMGAAFAANRSGTPRIYWVQDLATPP